MAVKKKRLKAVKKAKKTKRIFKCPPDGDVND